MEALNWVLRRPATKLGLQDVRDFYGRHSAAENPVVVAGGNFDPDLMAGFLKRELLGMRVPRRGPI